MCTSPRSVQFNSVGKLDWRRAYYNPELEGFKIPCGKCVECLLERSRDWAVRCTHEATIHAQNCFITLTYSDEYLPKDGALCYRDFQLFMKRLREKYGEGIGFFMCGEYGEQTKRPHYHACIFGMDFSDKKKVRENHHGDEIWQSEELTTLWGLGHTELGSVTQKSAGYVARYVLKKQDPNHPVGFQKMSRTHAIGKRFVEKWWHDIFVAARGSIIMSDGSRTKVPRYYEKWLQKNKPEIWLNYVTQIKPENTARLKEKADYENKIFLEQREKRGFNGFSYKSSLARKREILKAKQKQLKRSYL